MRIIESDQRTGIVIYEFYIVLADGTEERKQVKFESDQATLLDHQWQH
ncbi:hypothetical protein K0504_02255 [Neiella marina]|uniref:PepSY domain-containing protein n=1 Tax=Neiella holothuriorum TaxID=2870530 RepID=A0ABS7EBZ2_9GAMM|nr:hypothetical protein [Neiella holothuriorum]MBW8189844.1 hypothetical protein [Neiella holothuriorum]